MTLEEIRAALESTGLPVVYLAWPEKKAPPMPFLCYLVAYSNNFGADDRVYQKINHIQIELYTKTKRTDLEDKVESALSSLFWEKLETYIDSEKCYQIIYEIEV